MILILDKKRVMLMYDGYIIIDFCYFGNKLHNGATGLDERGCDVI